jgi:tRNA(adenine34) deaminase
MRAAIAEARRGFFDGQYAIGAVVVVRGAIVARAFTTLDTTRDPSAHAEVNAIRSAAARVARHDRTTSWATALQGGWLYSTHEPCSMCVSLAIWANLAGIVYGITMPEFLEANGMTRRDSHYIFLRCQDVARRGNPVLKVSGGFLRAECSELLTLRRSRGDGGTEL